MNYVSQFTELIIYPIILCVLATASFLQFLPLSAYSILCVHHVMLTLHYYEGLVIF